jgi:hypothetical protein
MMIGRVLAMAIGLIGALTASQLPEFAQQYRQRLGGAIDELNRVVNRFDGSAQTSGLSRDQAITRLREQPEPLARREGEAMGDLVERRDRLQRQRDDFASAGSFERMLVLIRQVDPVIARATYLEFEPAVPATSEGVVAAGGGFVLFWAAMLFFARLLGRLRPPLHRSRPSIRSA